LLKLDSIDPVLEERKEASRTLPLFGTFFGLALLAIAIWLFARTLHRYNLDEVIQHLKEIPVPRIILALVCAFSSYFIQSIYDFVGASSLKLGIPARRAMFAAFIGNAFTNNMGFSLLTGASLRFRFYLAWGVPVLAIAQIVVLAKLAFFNGLFVFTGIMQILAPIHLPESISIPLSPRAIGFFLLLPTAILFTWNGLSTDKNLKLGKWVIPKPGQRILLGQMLFASIQFIPAALTLYFLIPAEELIAGGFHGPWFFIGTFMAIKIVVMFLPIPGSLGVWEGTAMAILTPGIDDYAVLGALLGFRLIFYLIPFSVALIAFSGYELSSSQGLLANLRARLKSAKDKNKPIT
jgi:uncharacterized membrane protein YbhN (UPF0104 family)